MDQQRFLKMERAVLFLALVAVSGFLPSCVISALHRYEGEEDPELRQMREAGVPELEIMRRAGEKAALKAAEQRRLRPSSQFVEDRSERGYLYERRPDPNSKAFIQPNFGVGEFIVKPYFRYERELWLVCAPKQKGQEAPLLRGRFVRWRVGLVRAGLERTDGKGRFTIAFEASVDPSDFELTIEAAGTQVIVHATRSSSQIELPSEACH